MNRPAYLVEGDLEQDFVQQVCAGCPVKKINLNGKSARIEAIAKRVGSLGRLLQKRHSPLIVVFDRECRQESVEQLEIAFREALTMESIEVPVLVGIPDRNIEVWILADCEMFLQSANLPADTLNFNFEGKNGKKIIENTLRGRGRYVETIEGVNWLKAARPSIIQRHSSSFNRFFATLAEMECWWLNRS